MSTRRFPPSMRTPITSSFLRERPTMVPAATRIIPVPPEAVEPLRRMKNFMNKRNANAAAYRRYLNQMKAVPPPKALPPPNNGFRTPNTSIYVSPLSAEPESAPVSVPMPVSRVPRTNNRTVRNRLVRNITRYKQQQKQEPWLQRLAKITRRLFGGKRTRR